MILDERGESFMEIFRFELSRDYHPILIITVLIALIALVFYLKKRPVWKLLVKYSAVFFVLHLVLHLLQAIVLVFVLYFANK